MTPPLWQPQPAVLSGGLNINRGCGQGKARGVAGGDKGRELFWEKAVLRKCPRSLVVHAPGISHPPSSSSAPSLPPHPLPAPLMVEQVLAELPSAFPRGEGTSCISCLLFGQGRAAGDAPRWASSSPAAPALLGEAPASLPRG